MLVVPVLVPVLVVPVEVLALGIIAFILSGNSSKDLYIFLVPSAWSTQNSPL
jgi:hypothetical protein